MSKRTTKALARVATLTAIKPVSTENFIYLPQQLRALIGEPLIAQVEAGAFVEYEPVILGALEELDAALREYLGENYGEPALAPTQGGS